MEAYGVVHPAGIALRASFLIDENFDVFVSFHFFLRKKGSANHSLVIKTIYL
jgi:alkyl hydroperoxide reductase subunit AhpC